MKEAWAEGAGRSPVRLQRGYNLPYAVTVGGPWVVSSPSYAETILAWRRKLEESLRGDESWLETVRAEANDEG